MCGRYYIAEEDSAAELQEIIEQLNRRGAKVKTGEIYPTDTVPVLANNKSMVITPFAVKWGIHVAGWKTDHKCPKRDRCRQAAVPRRYAAAALPNPGYKLL